MKRMDKFSMQDYVHKKSDEKRFCIMMIDMEDPDNRSYSYFCIFYRINDFTRLRGQFVSKTTLTRGYKWLGTQTMRNEALTWCVSVPFNKGVYLGNNNHDIGTINDILPGGRFGDIFRI